MVHCPECESTIADESDVEFVEMDARIGVVRSSKRFYVANCTDCGYTIASGVAGAQANAGAAAGGGAD